MAFGVPSKWITSSPAKAARSPRWSCATFVTDQSLTNGLEVLTKSSAVRLEQKDQQFLYETDGMLVFMDSETYEQIELPAELLGERRPFLQDGMTITVEFYENEALNATLPQKVNCRVAETEPVVKGQTAANSFKPAILDNGVKVMVPPFVGPDEEIVVNTETNGLRRTRLILWRTACAGPAASRRRVTRAG